MTELKSDEAIRELKAMKPHIESRMSVVGHDAYDMAISALEKQIPKKPHEVQDKYNKNLFNLYCTSCANWIGSGNSRLKRVDMYNNSNNKICPYCGQAIEWEDME